MIAFIHGQLFESPAQVLTNTVNCVGVMGKGIALEFKGRYPLMYADYRRRCGKGEVRPGSPYLWEDDRTQILNFPTKDHWREPSRLEYVESGLKTLAATYKDLGIYSIAMPALGCGNGGLEWPEVKALMIRHLGHLPDLEAFVYEPRVAGQRQIADESDNAQITTLNNASSPAALPNL